MNAPDPMYPAGVTDADFDLPSGGGDRCQHEDVDDGPLVSQCRQCGEFVVDLLETEPPATWGVTVSGQHFNI